MRLGFGRFSAAVLAVLTMTAPAHAAGEQPAIPLDKLQDNLFVNPNFAEGETCIDGWQPEIQTGLNVLCRFGMGQVWLNHNNRIGDPAVRQDVPNLVPGESYDITVAWRAGDTAASSIGNKAQPIFAMKVGPAAPQSFMTQDVITDWKIDTLKFTASSANESIALLGEAGALDGDVIIAWALLTKTPPETLKIDTAASPQLLPPGRYRVSEGSDVKNIMVIKAGNIVEVYSKDGARGLAQGRLGMSGRSLCVTSGTSYNCYDAVEQGPGKPIKMTLTAVNPGTLSSGPVETTLKPLAQEVKGLQVSTGDQSQLIPVGRYRVTAGADTLYDLDVKPGNTADAYSATQDASMIGSFGLGTAQGKVCFTSGGQYNCFDIIEQEPGKPIKLQLKTVSQGPADGQATDYVFTPIKAPAPKSRAKFEGWYFNSHAKIKVSFPDDSSNPVNAYLFSDTAAKTFTLAKGKGTAYDISKQYMNAFAFNGRDLFTPAVTPEGARLVKQFSWLSGSRPTIKNPDAKVVVDKDLESQTQIRFVMPFVEGIDNGFSVEFTQQPGYYMIHEGGALKLEKVTDQSPLELRQRATFEIYTNDSCLGYIKAGLVPKSKKPGDAWSEAEMNELCRYSSGVWRGYFQPGDAVQPDECYEELLFGDLTAYGAVTFDQAQAFKICKTPQRIFIKNTVECVETQLTEYGAKSQDAAITACGY